MIFLTFALAISVPISVISTSNTYADKYDDQIRALQADIDKYNAEVSRLQGESNNLQNELEKINNEKAAIQGQIDISQAKYDKLVIQIKETEQQIADNQDVLGDTLADLYLDDNISALEMLASSKNIGDYVDKQTQRASIRDTITSTITKIKDLKADLEEQKTDVARTLGDQTNARNALSEKETEKEKLIAETQGQESAYQSLVAKSESDKLKVQQEQQAAIEAAMRRASGGGSVNILPGDPSKGGYPWEAGCYIDANAMSYGTDPLGYGCRQCVSYTAWKVIQRTGYYPYYWGNANMWPSSARAAGFSTGSTPRANSVGVISAGQYGHVVWVEAVNGDGTIDISQYNYYNAGGSGWGHYSEMRVSAGTYDTYIYF